MTVDATGAGEVTGGFAVLAERLEAGETLAVDQLGPQGAALEDAFASGTLGLVLDTLASDRVTGHLDVDARHHQPYGIVHGGVWASVIESMASIAAALRVAAHGLLCVGVNNTTDFLRSHRAGRIDAVATPVHVGRLQQLWLVVLTRGEDGKEVARGQVRLQNVSVAQLKG